MLLPAPAVYTRKPPASKNPDRIRLEDEISAALKHHLRAAQALREIRDRKLYRDNWANFDQYCRDRWHISRAQGNRLCDWAEVAENLSPLGDSIPERERHARPLTRLSPAQQRVAWKQLIRLPNYTEQTIEQICDAVAMQPLGKKGPLAFRIGEAIPSPLGWMGGKASIARQIASLLPPHDTYIEAFVGGAAVLVNKPRARLEIINDIHGEIVNFFRVLREPSQARRLKRLLSLTPYAREEHASCTPNLEAADAVERARRLFVRVRQSFGCAEGETWGRSLNGRQSPTDKYWKAVDRLDLYTERLRPVQIECRDFRSLLVRCDNPGVCVYADPPYLRDTRHPNGNKYQHEMEQQDHVDLLDILCGFKLAKVVLSGHDSELYNRRLKKWRRYEFSVTAKALFEKSGTSRRTEVVWVST